MDLHSYRLRLILQANRLTKCASHPIRDPVYQPYRTHHPDRKKHINTEKIGNVYRGKMRKKTFKIRFMINSTANVWKEMHSVFSLQNSGWCK